MNDNKFYLEIRDQRKGLLVKIETQTCYILTYSQSTALSFKSRYLAKKFINKNNLNNHFKVILL
jgi:hypothetical protein